MVNKGYKMCHSITEKCPVRTETVVVVNKGYQGCHSITETSPVQTELWLWLGI